MRDTQIDEQLARTLEEELIRRYGLMLPPAALASELCYPTKRAYQQAVLRRTLPVPTFQIEHRRGRFALAKDVAHWLAQQHRNAAVHQRGAQGDAPQDGGEPVASKQETPAKEGTPM